MSTYWDLHCRDCDESAGFHINHGCEMLASLWRNRLHWAPLARADLNDVDLRLHGDEGGGLRLFPAFAAAHFSHDVRPRDEYGRYDDQCRESVQCACCGHWWNCTGKPGHAGEHEHVRQTNKS